MEIDQDKLMDFLHKFVGDLGATMAAGNVLVGERLGLYRVLAEQPMLPHELAERTGTATRYVDEWLRGQAAGGYVEYDPQTGAYSLTPEQAFALTDPDGAVIVLRAHHVLPALRQRPWLTRLRRRHESPFRTCPAGVQQWAPRVSRRIAGPRAWERCTARSGTSRYRSRA
jgi:hypothetical protein